MNAFKRAYKRFIILLVVVLVAAGVVLLFYGVIGVLIGPPPPTCIDAIQNQGEDDVDCGGPCEECLLRTLSPIEIRAVDIISTLPGFADVVVWLENPNTNAGAARVAYTVTLSDSSGSLGSFAGDQFLLPGEVQFFVHSRVAVPRPPQTADVVVNGAEWQAFDRQPQVTLTIRDDVLFQPGGGAPRWQLRGVVDNSSSFDLDVVDVVSVLRDATGTVVAAGSHEVRTLRSGEERAFVISWPAGTALSAVSAQTSARTNIFSNANILIEYGAGDIQPFQRF